MHLHFLRDYLRKLDSIIAVEWRDIKSRSENGEFEEFGDYESAIDYPLFRSEYAARTVMYELNAMAEGVLQSLAEPFWREQQSSKKIKSIHDLPFLAILELVEKHYEIYLKDVDGSDDFEELRKMVNAFKHRKGFRRHKDMERNPETDGFEFQYRASLEQAEKFLDRIPLFLDGLYEIKQSKQTDA
ncbi:MAG: hypothetical protein V3R51_03435 [Gammaproteobacteria bacterium]